MAAVPVARLRPAKRRSRVFLYIGSVVGVKLLTLQPGSTVTCTMTNALDSGAYSLRAAISEAL